MLYNQIIEYMRLYNRFGKIQMTGILWLIFAFLLCFGCNSSKAENEKKAKGPDSKTEATISVSTGKTIERQIPSYIQATGSFIAEESSDVASKVAGKVINVYANVGQFVSQGSVIARLDDQDAQLRLREAQVGVKQAEVAIRQAEAKLGLSENGKFNSSTIPEVRAASATVEQLQTELKQAEVNTRQAEVNEKRYRELVESGDVAMITYEQYRTALDAARAARDSARARVKNAQEQLNATINTARQNNEAIKSAQANLEAAKTQVVSAQKDLNDLVVRAPFAGFVSNRPVAVGEFVTTSSPILTLLRVNPIKLQVQIAEADVSYVGMGRGVSVEVDAYKDRKFSGTITAINPALDTSSRSATIEAQIENGDNALRPGMFATVRIVRDGSSNGIFAPRASIFNDQSTQSYRIFVIQEGIAKLKVVQLGTEEGDMVQILSGVEGDQVVATSNLDQLYEGAKVQVQ